jgi:putative redox protein
MFDMNRSNTEPDLKGYKEEVLPQSYKSFDLRIRISGEGVTPKKMDRSVNLSLTKYCPVYHSLRKYIQVNVTYHIEQS